MYIANNTLVHPYAGILEYMPSALRRYMYNINLDGAREIHLQAGKPVTVYYNGGARYLTPEGRLADKYTGGVRVTGSDIREALEIAARSSLYSVSDEVSEGYITISGGHRIGICGQGVVKDGKNTFIKEVSALNYRLASEIKGTADKVIERICSGTEVKNTLIISPPGAGKTTMLRDIVRCLSYRGIRVSVADERQEIAAMRDGHSPFDLGVGADVLSGVPKAQAMIMLLRAMSPEVIVTDEIGGEQDIEAVTKIINCGAKIITTIHGFNVEQVSRRSDLCNLLEFFDLFITLSSKNGVGTVTEILKREEVGI